MARASRCRIRSTQRNTMCMYTYLKVTVAALRAWRLLRYISFLFLVLSRYNNFSARLICLLYKLLARTTVVVLVRSFCFYVNVILLYFLLFFYSFIVVCLEGLTGSDVSLRGKVSRCRHRGIYGSPGWTTFHLLSKIDTSCSCQR